AGQWIQVDPAIGTSDDHGLAVGRDRAAEHRVALGGQRSRLLPGDRAQIEPRALTRLARREHDLLSIRKEVGAQGVDSLVGKDAGFADARGKQDDLRFLLVRDRDRPGTVRREGLRRSGAETNRRRAVGLPQVSRVARSAALSGFRDQNPLAVRRNIRDERIVEPRELAILLFTEPALEDAEARALVGHQDLAVLRDVADRTDARHTAAETGLASRRDRVDRAVEAALRRRVPDLITVGRPREALDRRIDRRDLPLLPGEVHDANAPAVVVREGVVDECDDTALR